MKILISDIDANHSNLVEQAFLLGYNAYGVFTGTIEKRIESLSTSMAYAAANGFEIVIRSTTGMTSNISLAAGYYPDVVLFMPAGTNDYIQIYDSDEGTDENKIIVTGAGDDANETGYDVEFFAPDPITIEPDLSSFSNAYIAGQFAYLADTLDVSLHIARLLFRYVSQGYTNQNGYGKCLIPEAIDYYENATIEHIGEVGAITASLYDEDNFLLTIEPITNADTYQIFQSVNGGVFESITTPIIDLQGSSSGYGIFKFKYKGYFDNTLGIEESEFSEEVTISRLAFPALELYTTPPVSAYQSPVKTEIRFDSLVEVDDG